jgi:hypothetical protein
MTERDGADGANRDGRPVTAPMITARQTLPTATEVHTPAGDRRDAVRSLEAAAMALLAAHGFGAGTSAQQNQDVNGAGRKRRGDDDPGGVVDTRQTGAGSQAQPEQRRKKK